MSMVYMREHIVYLVSDVGNDPVNTVLGLLPKLSYAIESGIANTRINSLLSMLSELFGITPVDLTTAGVYKILNDELLVPENITLSEEEFTALIKALSGCGTAVTKTCPLVGSFSTNIVFATKDNNVIMDKDITNI